MIISNDRLNDYKLQATDGDIGHVKDLFVDDQSWAVRYLVVETGSWISRNRVLIPTEALGGIDSSKKTIQVTITREQVKHSPHVDTAMPVSRQHETDLSGYYGFPTYHEGAARPKSDPHLRSAAALRGYVTKACGDNIGHVHQFLIDDSNWKAATVVVKTGTWWHGDLMRVDAGEIECVDWDTSCLALTCSRDSLSDADQHKE